ncbi:MAG TPA: multiheme c-type cytochrome [Methylomirabilota bacterium]|nr:multiheme c-type cytochrome [Methylomirabilota bacterium]
MRLTRLAALALSLSLVAAAPGERTAVEEFVQRHWKTPLAEQGPAPARFSPLEASLHPEQCGACHPAQYADWRTSWHAAAMGPGVLGQVREMLASSPAQALSCLGCHAPLAEQAPVVRAAEEFRINPVFEADLLGKGLTCAGCHVRAHQRFGPPRRDGTLESPGPRERLPHGGATRTAAFLAAEFCRGCHQFDSRGLALNGKLLENTYEEWKASRFARAGVQCQDCHMPDRRHLWRGIHDPDMVRAGLTITAEAGAARYRVGDTAIVTLRIASTAVGHAFPTYVTPRVVAAIEVVDAAGRAVEGSRVETVIGREVSLDLSRELSDTRLSPGQSASLVYRGRVERPGLRARASVTVYPDAFYTRFFEALLAQGAGQGAPEIRQALEQTRRSSFRLFDTELPLS